MSIIADVLPIEHIVIVLVVLMFLCERLVMLVGGTVPCLMRNLGCLRTLSQVSVAVY
jgi:hypothetical protein